MNATPPLTLFLIAGEASGDALGAKLMAALKKQSARAITFHGIGGDRMAKEGLISLFPMQELSIMGFVEILPHARRLLGRIRQTTETIRRVKPDAVITIDAPGFNFRIAKALRNADIPLMHYVAPTVWAYKPKRAQKIAELYDHLLALLPFEPPYFERAGLACTFIGHPIVEEKVTGGNGKRFRKKHGIAEKAPLLCLLPGSRPGEVKRLLPVFSEATARLHQRFKHLHAVILTTPLLQETLRMQTQTWPCPLVLCAQAEEKADMFAACTAALAKSGTATLELAMAGVPMAVAYRVHPLSAWMLRRMITVPYVTLVNLIVNKPVIPELLQEQCNPIALAETLERLLRDSATRKKQLKESRPALKRLGLSQSPSPSEKAAEAVLQLLRQ